PEVDEASEEEEAAVAAGEAVQKESAEILGRRRELTTRDMARGQVARVLDWFRSGSRGGFNEAPDNGEVRA
ncbi:unnamed protein product, partial [Urochloa humidicola]